MSNAVDPDFLEDFGRRWQDAVNRQAIDEIETFCADDLRFSDPGLIEESAGKSDLRPYFKRIWRAFPDLRFTRPDPGYFAPREGDFGIARWISAGTMTGPLDPPGFAPTNATIEMHGVDVWEFRDGLVTSWEGFYDATELGREVGALPAVGSATERLAALLQHGAARRLRRAAAKR